LSAGLEKMKNYQPQTKRGKLKNTTGRDIGGAKDIGSCGLGDHANLASGVVPS